MTEHVFTERQIYALTHPLDRSDNVPRPPWAGCVQTLQGKWTTILEVSLLPALGWLWMASVSRLHAPGGRAYKVGKWKPGWRDEADAILAELLVGVGDGNIDVSGRARAEGHDPEALNGYHCWRFMTPAEVALIGKQCGEPDA